ncbi:hypothetical protein [Pseudarthrobacter sp. 1C304]|uniref:hypothetical protein n=1 Tax=Pseudarthrobacter sp. 1C304 TaxID=3457438 RepID=UPI003FD4AD6D
MSTSQLGGAVHVSAENLHGQHHAEIVVFTRDPDGPGAFGMIYNTLGLADDVSDEELDARFRALDPEELKKDFGGDVVWLNGPRRALMDRMTLVVFEDAKVSMVGPIPMRTVATVSVPDLDAFVASERPPYTEITVGRTTEWFFNAGRQVYQLVSPAGSVYIMQSASQHVDPANTVDRLATLGERLKLPQGWEYRTPTLQEDLVVRADAEGTPAHIVLDEYEDNYQRIDNA